jgi:hypothetical protein
MRLNGDIKSNNGAKTTPRKKMNEDLAYNLLAKEVRASLWRIPKFLIL